MPTTVLIADDHPVIRDAVSHVLAAHSFQVCGEAVDGKEVIEKVIELRPDFVLMDIRIPVMNGLAAAETIRLVSPRTKIVFLTLYEAHIFVETTRSLADGFVSKFEAATKLIPTLNELELQRYRYLKYRWQRVVADTFACGSTDLSHKINAAERAIAQRLVQIDPSEKDERKALKEALQALSKLLFESHPRQKSTKSADVA